MSTSTIQRAQWLSEADRLEARAARERQLLAAGVQNPARDRFLDTEFGPIRGAVDVAAIDEGALEKKVEAAGDKLMAGFGFSVVRFSHPGPTKQTPGIPDRRYYRRSRLVQRHDGQFLRPALVCWWEAKSATGRQRPDQREFMETAQACGDTYLLGGVDVLEWWLIEQGVCERVGNVLEPLD